MSGPHDRSSTGGFWCSDCCDWSADADGYCLDCGCGDPDCTVQGCASSTR